MVLHINVGDAMSCSRLKCSGADQGHECSHSDWRPAMRLMEYERASWFCLLSNLQGTAAYLPQAAGWKNDIICLQETHGKDECLQAQVLHTQFRMFGTFVSHNVNVGGSFF